VSTTLSSIRVDDAPWRRLPWSLPAGVLLALIALTGLVRMLAESPAQPAEPLALTAQLIEQSAPEPAASAAPAPSEPLPAPAPELVTPKSRPAPPPPRHVRSLPNPVARPSESPAPAGAAPTAAPSRDAAEQAATSASPTGGRMSARALFQPLPEIPDELRRGNLQAVAVARFRVAADGSARVELVRATNDTRLNQVLLAALARWRFFPAMEQGRPVASDLEIRLPISVR